jgi:hypothetical protein
MEPIKKISGTDDVKDIRAVEKEGDQLFRRKQYSDAARKFGEAAMRYEKAGFGSMAAAAESKRVTCVNNAKNKTDDHSAEQSLRRWASQG